MLCTYNNRKNCIFCCRVEHLASEEDAPYKSLPFYGGAKGKYLLIHPSGRTSITNRNPSFYGIKDEEDEEEDVGMENESSSEESEANSTTNGSGQGEDNTGVCVGLPPDNASVAEAKPVGLAVAGPGGVASSKPVGTAVVGPYGLAVAKPVATAIAGVPGAEQLVGLGSKKSRPYKPHASAVPTITNKTKEDRSAIIGRSVQNRPQFEYSNSIPQGYNVIYVPMYMPNNARPLRH